MTALKYATPSLVLFISSIRISQPVHTIAWRCYAGAFLMILAAFLLVQAINSIKEGN
jgi:hypothetical protein